MTSDPLETALSASRPLPASNAEECADMLRNRRRITVADHARFRETLDDPHRDDADIDETSTTATR